MAQRKVLTGTLSQVRQYSPEDRPVIAGSGCDSTAGTIELSLCMAANGADCLLVITPSYFKSQMTSAAIRKHYELVADAVEPLPIILYNMPAITGIDLNPDDVEALADIENIVGVKDSGGDITRIGKMVHQTRDKDFQVIMYNYYIIIIHRQEANLTTGRGWKPVLCPTYACTRLFKCTYTVQFSIGTRGFSGFFAPIPMRGRSGRYLCPCQHPP